MAALALSHNQQQTFFNISDFKSYLEHSLNNPFIIDLKNKNLLEVVDTCARIKTKLHPHYYDNIGGLIHNLRALEQDYNVTLQPIQITDVFWSYFIEYCQNKNLKPSTIGTMCNQLRSVLAWASKHNATVSSSYADIIIPKSRNEEIALTADEISRITYFDIDRFYSYKRKDYRLTMKHIRDHFVLSANLFQRYSDMIKISPSCFENGIFKIVQQKTGNLAVVDIDKYSINPTVTYRLLDEYCYKAPYTHSIGNYNFYLHQLMKDIGFDEPVRREEWSNGTINVTIEPKWKLISSHTARRSALSIGVLRGHNVYALKKCSGHSSLDSMSRYIWEN